MASELWRALWEKKGTRREHRFVINGVEYGEDSQISHKVVQELYQDFGFGNASTAKLSLTILANNIPRGAKIERFIRLINGGQTTEWVRQGIFFINKRAEEDGTWDIEAFDAMRKAETEWVPRQSLNFPMKMSDAVTEFARIMGCEIDPRTYINPAYTLDYPASMTIRQELQYIAAAHGGNWIVTGEGKLLLVPLISMPEETHYLITEYGSAITIGGVRILV